MTIILLYQGRLNNLGRKLLIIDKLKRLRPIRVWIKHYVNENSQRNNYTQRNVYTYVYFGKKRHTFIIDIYIIEFQIGDFKLKIHDKAT